MSTTPKENQPLVVVVSGGGPVGLTFSLHLTMMMGEHVKILIYEGRWFVDDRGKIRWQSEEQGKTRRDQVVTLQDHVIQQMPEYIQKGLFQNINERVWPTSRNIAIREVEDRLLDLTQPFVENGQIELIPENLHEQSECLIKGDFDILVGADGSGSFVRQYCNIQMISEGVEYACGVAYNIPNEVAATDEPLHQTLNCLLTISQTRYLVNSSTSRRGYLNIRLIQSEYDALREDLQELQLRNEPIDLLDYNKCPQSPVWTIIRQGLDFFKIPFKYVVRVVPIVINVRHASIVVRELRFEVEKTEQQTKDPEKKIYKTALVFLAGDAAMNVHFWPGRGMNSGMKGAMALARNILRSCISNNSIRIPTPLRFLDFLDYEGFMARLRAREQQGRSLRILIDPIDKSIEASYALVYTNHCYVTYTKKLLHKLKETRERLEGRPEWPHKSRQITNEELESAVNRISAQGLAQLTLANPWPTREMSGVEVLVEDAFPYDFKNFLPVPETSHPSPGCRPSVIIRHRSVILWITGNKKMESVEKLIQNIQNSGKFIKSSGNTDDAHQLTSIKTIEEAKEWIEANRESILKSNVSFKVITSWTIKDGQTAVDVIRAVRSKVPQVPVLVFTNKHEETQPALEFPNVMTTDIEFELKEFVGVNQETQWNAGYQVSYIENIELQEDDNPQLQISTLNTDTKWKQEGITKAGGNGEGNQLNQLAYPVGIFIDDDQTIYIADIDNHRIVEWKCNATNGQIVVGGNGKGNQTNQLNCPTDVIIDKENNSLIISDGRNRRVMRWSLQNNTKNGEIIISDIVCSRLTMDKDGSIYVSDYYKNEVRRWRRGDEEGTIVAGGNGKENHLNQLNVPSFMFVDEDYSLYVADCGNHRVMKWVKDAKEGIVVAGGNGGGNRLTQLSGPQGVIVDQLGHIYVADLNNNRVMRWCKGAKEGTIVVGGNGEGQQTNQLYRPYGLSFDREGNLYVADCRNHRIQKFEIN